MAPLDSLLLSPLFPMEEIKPLTRDEEEALVNYHLGLEHAGIQVFSAPTSAITSPTSSCTTLSLEDDQIKRIFAANKPNGTIATNVNANTDIDTTNADADADTTNSEPTLADVSPDSVVYTTALFSSSSSYASLPPDQLNPHAAPFLFKGRLPPAPPPPPAPPALPAPQEDSPPPAAGPKSRFLLRPAPSPLLPRRISKWLRTFTIATTAPIGNNDVYSLIVVSADGWAREEMMRLAREVCWRAVEVGGVGVNGVGNGGNGGDVEALLQFVEVLVKQFRKMRSEEKAEEVMGCLREVLVGAFISAWDAKNNPEAISYAYTPEPRYVAAAIRLGGIIGSLHVRGVIPASDVASALETLMNNFVSTEHLDALDALVCAAGEGFWCSVEQMDRGAYVGEFLEVLGRVGGRLGGEMSVLGRGREEEGVKRLVGGVRERVGAWRERVVLEEREGRERERRERERKAIEQERQYQMQLQQQRMGMGMGMGGAPMYDYQGMQMQGSMPFVPYGHGYDQTFGPGQHRAQVMGQAYS